MYWNTTAKAGSLELALFHRDNEVCKILRLLEELLESDQMIAAAAAAADNDDVAAVVVVVEVEEVVVVHAAEEYAGQNTAADAVVAGESNYEHVRYAG